MTKNLTQPSPISPALETEPATPPYRSRGGLGPVVVLLLVVVALVAGIGWGGYLIAARMRIAQIASQCHAAWRAKQWTQVESLAQTWIRWDREAATPWIYLADSAQQKGDYEQAAKYLDQLPDKDPKTTPALLERTTLLFGPLNRPLEGIKTCERILALNPAVLEARQRLIFFYAQTLLRTKLLEQIREAIRNGTDTRENYVYLVGANYLVFSNGAQQNHLWLKGTPDHEDFLVARALHLIGTGMVGDEASDEPDVKKVYDVQRQQMIKEHEAVLSGYLERFPHNMELLVYFLMKASNNGELERVAELLKKAPPEAAQDSRFWRYKGWLLMAQQRYTEAEQSYRKALELHPFDYSTHHQLAQVLRYLGRQNEVDWMQGLSNRGTELRKVLLQLPDARSVTPKLLVQMADYIQDCGDQDVAEALRKRIDQLVAAAPSR